MKKFVLIILFGALFHSSYSVHIVGGELEFIFLSDGLYQINAIQYFDEASTNPGPEGQVTVYLFRNGDNELMQKFTLNRILYTNIDYTNIECVREDLMSSKVIWSQEFNLNPLDFDNPAGYYFVWERCCRNANIANIVTSNSPGMKYTIEIPPLSKNNKVFKNSSPGQFQPLRDYACIDQLYYIDFVGKDLDGDSLVYSMVAPLNSSASTAVPTPKPKPHFELLFNDGFSVNNMISGVRPLQINSKGLMTVIPDTPGLYVFSVLIEEYRNNEKIGEVRRDFQMLVVDGCEPPDPPVVDIEIPGDPDFNPKTDILNYTVGDQAKCFDFLISNVTAGETISLRAEGVNFDDNLNDIFTINQIPVGADDSQLRIEVCIPNCPPIRGSPFILDLIAGDDACPLPQLDTVRLTINVEPPPNSLPLSSYGESFITINENEIYTQTINATDSDGDSLTMSLFIEGLDDPSRYGFNLSITENSAGSIEGIFEWDTSCSEFDFSEFQHFKVGVIIDDIDECDLPNTETKFINSTVILPPNSNPVVSSSQQIPSTIFLGSTLELDISATDSDGDDVSLFFAGGNFDAPTYDVEFTPASGNTSVSSSFIWDLSCNASIYDDGQQFELLFIADDADYCKVKNFDTLRHIVTVNYPPNEDPQFKEIVRRRIVRVNEPIEIDISAFDSDIQDEITMRFAEGIRKPASSSLTLETVTGQGSIASVLQWRPECSLLRFGETSKLVDVVLQVTDNACPINNIDTLKFTFEIIDDTDRQKSFLPPNVFTPNGDQINDTFSLVGNLDTNQNLPPDNCDNTFLYAEISNRAGLSVFRSEHRDFVWSGGQFPPGVYYYVIKYTNSEYKGFIHLMR